MVGKILIVDGVATNRIVLKVALAEAFYHPVLACDGESCLRLTSQNVPDLILLDLNLPDMAGIEVIQQLRANPATRDLPILALVSAQDAPLRLQALLAGADDVLLKHGAMQTLLSRLRNLLRGHETLEGLGAHGSRLEVLGLAESPCPFVGPAIIAMLASPTEDALGKCAAVAKVMTDRITLQSREDALAECNINLGQQTPDVFVINANTGGMADALRLMSELRSRAATRHSAICILAAESNDAEATMAYDLGADDLVDFGITTEEFALRLTTLIRRKRREDQLRASVQNGLRLAMIDPLTGLHNRRYALPQLAAMSECAMATGSLFAVMVIDLDRFKSVNDRLGHASGDAVLVEVARRLRLNLRTGDLLARIGGEEFLVALPDTTLDEARSAAGRLCHAIEEQEINLGFATNLKVTVSIGLAVSTGSEGPEDIKAIVDRADRALLRAKAEGRNQVTISQSAA